MTASTQSLTFLTNPTLVAVSVVIVLLTMVFSTWIWARSGYRGSVAVLESLRVLCVLLAAALFNQPEWIEEFRPEQKPVLAVLWDATESMQTRDVRTAADGGTGSAITRADAIRGLTQSEFWSQIDPRLDVIVEAIQPTETPAGTDLGAPLSRLAESPNPPRAIVLMSDGDWTVGTPPALAASALRVKDIPIFGIPVGSRSRLPDLELVSLDVPTFGIAGKALRIPFSIESSLPRDVQVTARVKTSSGEEITKEVRIAAMGRTQDWVIWKPATTGEFTVTLDIPHQPDELLADNNSLTAPVSIREEKLKVLVVESIPRWEYRYLRNALSRDPGVDVSCLLFHPGLSKVGGGNKDYIRSFPSSLEELGQYDVVFLGDVGCEDGQLTTEQCHWLRGLVEYQASGLVFLPGWQGRQVSLLDTELSDLLPVVLDPAQPGGWGSRTASHFELTELGRRSLLTKLADTHEENAEVWENLPGFQWYAPVTRAKAGAEVLCVHKDLTNQYGRLPLLVTKPFGAGKILFMGTDGAWRWRKGVEDRYHYRFWGQVVRWMAYQRHMAKGETMRLYYSPEQPHVRQTLTLSANVMEKSGEPVTRGEVVARITSPTGKVETVRFESTGDEWGAFSGRYQVEEPGPHQIALTCKETGALLETSFYVQGQTGERIGRPARPEVIEELARLTQGQILRPEETDKLRQAIASLPEPPLSVKRLQIWCHPLAAGALVFLLTAFWIGRKAQGLV